MIERRGRPKETTEPYPPRKFTRVYEDEYTTPKFEFNEESYEDDLSEDEDEAEEEWPFPKERPIEGSNEVPWPGVAPSVSAQYAVKDSNAN